jgi:hypothetical protein
MKRVSVGVKSREREKEREKKCLSQSKIAMIML